MKYAPFVEFCVKGLVEHPEEVSVEEVEDEGTVQVRVHTHPDDAGKVIGKNGRLVMAIRSIVASVAHRNGERAFVKVITEGDDESR